MSLILGHYGDVLRAFAVLANAAPSNTDYNIHLNYIKDYTYEGYIAALNDIFAGVSDADMAALMLRNTGLDTIDLEGDGNNDNTALAQAFITANAADRVSAILNLTKVLQGSSLAPAAAFNANFDAAYAYATNSENTTWRAFDGSVEQVLTVGMDKLVGGAMDDFFKAYLVNGANTFQDGDVLDGGTGEDTLYADIDAAENGFAITGETKGIENVLFRVQNGQIDSGDNNIAGVGVIDAQRMHDVLNWENNNSRADLVIEDIHINDDQITKDITITMRETDPGQVDYGVYFDQNSLRNVSENASQMNLRVLDTYAVAQGLDALKDSPYGAFTFYVSVNGGTSTKVKLESQAMQDAKTLPEMVTAIQAAADAYFGTGAVTVTLGSAYTVKDSVTGNDVTGNEIVVSAKSSAKIVFSTTEAGSGWLATDNVPAVSGLYTSFSTGGSVNTELVTSTVVLDYVGRGSMGGDLVIGGLSVGDTSDSKGVQQFNITVEDDSELQTIQSTDNTLQVVNIVNGTQTRVKDAYNEYDELGGKLVVTGTVAGGDVALPGTAATHEAYGFTDVREINASAMTGKLEFTAQITKDAIDKYIKTTDTGVYTAEDVTVAYTGGSNNDKMTVDLDADAVASHSNVNTSRADFFFQFEGGAGNDVIDVAIDRDVSALTGGTQYWYTNQVINNNITINAGAGNDTIKTPGAGNMKINAGEGADTVYADNTGAQVVQGRSDTGAVVAAVDAKAMWVFNTTDQAGAVVADRNVFDLQSSTIDTRGSWGVTATVNYRGLTAKVAVADTTDYKLNDLEINQAIKKAINEDATLNKLLVAEDGPAGTLVIKSLIDGVYDAADLTVTLNAPLVGDISAATVTAYNTANGTAHANAAAVLAEINANVALFQADYATVMGADNTVTEIVGANSVSTSDNVIEGAAGNDVIVLGTTDDGATAVGSSNDTVKYTAAFDNDVIVNFTNAAAVSGAIPAAKEIFTTTFGAATVVDAGDGATTVAFDGVTVNYAAGAYTAVQVASTFVTAYNAVPAANYDAVDNGDGTVTFSAKVAGAVGDVVAGDFVVTDPAAVDDDTDAVNIVSVTLNQNGANAVVGTPLFGDDKIDFTAINGKAAAGFTNATGVGLSAVLGVDTIIIDDLVAAATPHVVGTANDSAAHVTEVFKALDGAVSATATKQIYVAVDLATNIGTVYQVTNGTAASDAAATLMGTIDLADTLWTSLVAADFA